jgi:hypothetical protein
MSATKPLDPRIVELNPPNAPDKHAVFIGKVFVWEFDYEHEAKELLDNLTRALAKLRAGEPTGEKP